MHSLHDVSLDELAIIDALNQEAFEPVRSPNETHADAAAVDARNQDVLEQILCRR